MAGPKPEGFEDFDPHEETQNILADGELMESLRVSRAEAADRKAQLRSARTNV